MISYISKRYHNRCKLGLVDDVLGWVAIYGYFAGGTYGGGNKTATTDRISFSDGLTSANTISNLSANKSGVTGLSDKKIYGYFAGDYTTLVDRIIFSNGLTSANTVSNLSQARAPLASLSDGIAYGYFAGGYTGSAVSVSTADRIDFSDGVTVANTISNLSLARWGLTGVSDGVIYGYFAGGTTVGYSVATTDRISFSSGITVANTSSNLSYARTYLAGLSDNNLHGYFAGGYTYSGGATYFATVDRIIFSTGITAINTSLSAARYEVTGLSDGKLYGYFGGGYNGGDMAITDRINFSSGILAVNSVSNLSQAREDLASLSDFAV